MSIKSENSEVALKRPGRSCLRDVVLLGALCGVFACNYFGFGLARVFCHGLLAVSLGAPAREVYARRVQHQS